MTDIQPIALTIQVELGDSNAEELDKLTGQLFGEIQEMDVDSVRPQRPLPMRGPSASQRLEGQSGSPARLACDRLSPRSSKVASLSPPTVLPPKPPVANRGVRAPASA